MRKLTPMELKARRQRAAETKLWKDYVERFGGIGGELDRERYRLFALSLTTGVDQLAEEKRRQAKASAAWHRKIDKFLATPITAAYEKKITATIKGRALWEGACFEVAFAMYFKFRDEHPGEVEALTANDLAYAGQWFRCAVRAA